MLTKIFEEAMTEAGFMVIKGSKAYTIWSARKKAKKENESGEEKEYKFFGLAKLFSEDQVEKLP